MRVQRNHGRRLSAAERLEIQRRVGSGATHAAVAVAVGCSTKSVQRLLIRTGGLVPRREDRSLLHLSLAEREEISRALRSGDSRRAIARRLGRSPSSVSREVMANGGHEPISCMEGRAELIRKAHRPKVAKLVRYPRLRAEVERLLAECWSPEQIANRLAKRLFSKLVSSWGGVAGAACEALGSCALHAMRKGARRQQP